MMGIEVALVIMVTAVMCTGKVAGCIGKAAIIRRAAVVV
jgi:hypothetical protein